MSPATPQTRELAARESDGIHVLLLWHPQRERAHRLGRGRPRRRPLPARGRARPRPRRLLPPLRLRRLRRPNRRTVMFRTKHAAPQTVAQPGGPHGPLERGSLEDRHVRLARLRRRRLRARRHGRRRRASTRTRRGRASPAAWTRSSTTGFKQPAGESVLIQSRSLACGDPAFTAAIERRRRARLEAGGRPERPLAARSAATRARSRRTGTPRSSSSTSAATRTRRVDKIDPVLDTRRRRAARPSGLLHRRVRRRERGRRESRRRTRTTSAKAGHALAPDHADHPRARVRRARGGGHPAAARADRRVRDVRADRAAQPPAAGRSARPPRWCS